MNPPADDPPKRSGPAASAGIVLWRRVGGDRITLDHEFEVGRDIEILLVHPGGPFWARKDEHAWSIPKGEFNPDDEDPRAAAQREFEEELGQPVPSGSAIELRPFQAGRKRLYPFAIEGDSAQATAATRNIRINTRRLPVDHMGYPATVHVYQVHRTVALACRAAAQD